jgi:hypothetical protein
MGIQVTTANTGVTITLCIYTAGPGGNPHALVLNAGDADGTTVGVKQLVVPATQLPAGDYWLGVRPLTAAVELRNYNTASPHQFVGFANLADFIGPTAFGRSDVNNKYPGALPTELIESRWSALNGGIRIAVRVAA